ncbi:MAG: glycosyltransferase family 4 protein [Actinomycetota bacterium]|nr:glycosyltransferase family 4 protein [Actinomycetota bacterium]
MIHNYYQQPGGEDLSFEQEAKLLEERDHFVLRHSLSNDAISGMNKIGLAARTLYNFEQARRVSSLIHENSIDLVHLQNTFPLISLAVVDSAFRAKVPVVVSVRNYRFVCPAATLFRHGEECQLCVGRSLAWPGVIHACYRGSYSGSATVAAMLALHRARGTFSRVSAYVALTDFVKQKLIEGGIPASLISIKPNFVDPDPGAGPGDGGFALFVGRLTQEKGIGVLLEAASLGDFNLRIVGDGPLAKNVLNAQSNGRVTWTRFLPHHDLMTLIGQASLLIVPSVWPEPFGRVVVEAFATGTPVVASNLAPLRETVRDATLGGLFQPGNPRDLANHVKSMMDDTQRLAAMRAATRTEFLRRFSADANYEMLLQIYRSVLSERGED